MIPFSQSDLTTPERTERVLRLFEKAINSRVAVKPEGQSLGPLIRQVAPLISRELQANGSAPLNLTDLLPSGSGNLVIEGTHSNRLVSFTPPASVGLLFWETDRNVLYVSVLVSGSIVWHYAAGTYENVIASRPSDLGVNDIGFNFVATDDETLSVWDGSAWIEIGSSQYPVVIDTVALTGQTADIAPTMFVDSDVVGTFRCNYYLETTTAHPTAGDVELEVAFTDDVGAETVNSATLPLTTTGRTSGVFFIQTANTDGITYATTITGAASGSAAIVTRGYLFGSSYIVTGGYMAASGGLAEYALYLSLERLS